MQPVAIGRSDHLTFIEINQNESPLDGAHHQRAKILIKNQYPVVHRMKYKPNLRVFQENNRQPETLTGN
ncbi:MAG: hypothetical protein C0523_04600 [Cytophaga sp.]|nr:hypothetical protein [Cytophaga sp.]